MRTIALVFAALFAACAPVTTTPARDELAGLYKVGGGDASIDIVRALTDAFAAKHPGVKFDIDTSLGSDPAPKLTGDGTLDIGMAKPACVNKAPSLGDRERCPRHLMQRNKSGHQPIEADEALLEPASHEGLGHVVSTLLDPAADPRQREVSRRPP